MSDSSDAVRVVISLPQEVQKLIQVSKLNFAIVFILVVSCLFQDLSFQLFKHIMELDPRVHIAGFFDFDLVLKSSYLGS